MSATITLVLEAIPQMLTLAEEGLPIVESVIAAVKKEIGLLTSTGTITVSQIAADDAALDAADATLQAAQPSTPSAT